MWKTTLQQSISALALWSGIWITVSALLEWWHRGFVVHHINTRWVWLVFAATGALYLFLKTKNPD
ncbi:MAG: hypothetical protein HY437_01715 [Candidatus Magasanikbacteria bacterium]|nr:hypothetical protein [Candidatus Magasanikbacteria bacterium]